MGTQGPHGPFIESGMHGPGHVGLRTGRGLFVGVVLVREEDARSQARTPCEQDGLSALLVHFFAGHDTEENCRLTTHMHERIVCRRWRIEDA